MRAVTSDKVTGVRTNIPPPLQYPVVVGLSCASRRTAACVKFRWQCPIASHLPRTRFGVRRCVQQRSGFNFVSSLITMFYGDGLLAKGRGIVSLIGASLSPKPDPSKKAM